MAAQVGWSAASIFIALAVTHACEEIAAELRSVKAVSLARLQDLVGERIGPLLLLATLAAAGVLVDDFWLWLALGITAADVAQHAAYSIRARAYTPGVATGTLLAAYVLASVDGWMSDAPWRDPSSWGAMVIGVAFVAMGNLSAPRKGPPSQEGRPPRLQLLLPRHRRVRRAGGRQTQILDR
jgi:hypothetical protein